MQTIVRRFHADAKTGTNQESGDCSGEVAAEDTSKSLDKVAAMYGRAVEAAE